VLSDFDPLVDLAYRGVVAVAGLLGRRKRVRAFGAREWRSALRRVGLEPEPTSTEYSDLTATSADFSVAIQLRSGYRPRAVDTERVTVRFLGSKAHRFEIASVEFGESLRGRADVEIGHDDFDFTFLVGGAVNRLLASLDSTTRFEMVTISKLGTFRFDSEVMQVEAPEPALALHGRSRLLNGMLLTGSRLRSDLDIAAALRSNAREDPIHRVRLVNLQALLRMQPREESTGDLLRLACADRSVEVRLCAAEALGGEGVATLRGLAADWNQPDPYVARAIASLGSNLGFEEIEAFLRQAIRTRRLETGAACIQLLASAKDEGAAPLLSKVVLLESGPLAVAAANALGNFPGAIAESALRDSLADDALDLLAAASEALGRIGTIESVAALRALGERRADRELRRKVRQAIAAIQARVPGAAPGQLSLSAAEGGQLSLAEAQRGQLSLPAAASGSLTLPTHDGALAAPGEVG